MVRTDNDRQALKTNTNIKKGRKEPYEREGGESGDGKARDR